MKLILLIISSSVLTTLTLTSMNSIKMNTKVNFNPEIRSYLETVQNGFDNIPEERKEQLEEIASFVKMKVDEKESANLLFICTHNSRRSHMGQLWAKVAADYYGIKGVNTFSGGTEATAFNPRAVASMERAGFEISKTNDSKNPVYLVKYASDLPEQKAWSKIYSDLDNPQENFAAIMTCSSADRNCPIVRGASERIAIPYEDPKIADGTPEESARYDERCLQIATEMMYCFSRAR